MSEQVQYDDGSWSREMVPNPTLADFLLARIAEDEAVAREAVCSCGGPACNLENGWYDRGELDVRLDEQAKDIDHILAWSPARVVAECEAKRRIVENCADRVVVNNPCRYLALPYADHPDYREEWKP